MYFKLPDETFNQTFQENTQDSQLSIMNDNKIYF